MRVAVYVGSGAGHFAREWLTALRDLRIDYVEFSRLDLKALEELKTSDLVLMHWSHLDPKMMWLADGFLEALEHQGVAVFPNRDERYHFDDKVAQAYLFRAAEICVPKTWVHTNRAEALGLIQELEYPVVAKLAKGAASTNVTLLRNVGAARRHVNRSFGSGFPTYNYIEIARRRWKMLVNDISLAGLGRAALSTFRAVSAAFFSGERESGYIYFQEFVPGLSSDYRVVILGNKAVCIRRGVPQGDFRASGSGNKEYGQINEAAPAVRLAYETAKRLGFRSMAFDVVIPSQGSALIIEASYAFSTTCYPGYWDADARYIDRPVNAPRELLMYLLGEISARMGALEIQRGT